MESINKEIYKKEIYQGYLYYINVNNKINSKMG